MYYDSFWAKALNSGGRYVLFSARPLLPYEGPRGTLDGADGLCGTRRKRAPGPPPGPEVLKYVYGIPNNQYVRIQYPKASVFSH